MGEPGTDHESGLIDVTQVPLADLAMLDDPVFGASVERLLRMWGSAEDRCWDNG